MAASSSIPAAIQRATSSEASGEIPQ